MASCSIWGCWTCLDRLHRLCVNRNGKDITAFHVCCWLLCCIDSNDVSTENTWSLSAQVLVQCRPSHVVLVYVHRGRHASLQIWLYSTSVQCIQSWNPSHWFYLVFVLLVKDLGFCRHVFHHCREEMEAVEFLACLPSCIYLSCKLPLLYFYIKSLLQCFLL